MAKLSDHSEGFYIIIPEGNVEHGAFFNMIMSAETLPEFRSLVHKEAVKNLSPSLCDRVLADKLFYADGKSLQPILTIEDVHHAVELGKSIVFLQAVPVVSCPSQEVVPLPETSDSTPSVILGVVAGLMMAMGIAKWAR